MPNNNQAKKRVRQNVVHRLRNRVRKAHIRTYGRRIDAALEAGDFATAEAEYVTFQMKVDKAAKTHTIHVNAAARRKSRMASRIHKAKAAAK
ncbi:MAG: 30S ribosomal protein S20 [Planctomycetes bacterium]|nr:30S ribosomal protein S20 [Planctomycetota bacterium]